MDEFDKIRELSQAPISTEENDEACVSSPFLEKQETTDYLSSLASLDDIDEKEDGTMKLHLLAIGIFSLVLILILAGFFFFGDRVEEVRDPPVISPTATPVKVKPEQPGGLVIPDQDKVIYDRMRSDALPERVERLFPESEKPALPETDKDFINPKEIKALDPLTEPIKTVPAVPKFKTPEVLPLPTKPVVKTPPKVQKPTVTSGPWRAQLMSSPNENLVKEAWRKISQKHASLLSDMPYEVVQAEIQGKGTFYRLRVGKFATREMAANLCAKLKNQKQDCVPAK